MPTNGLWLYTLLAAELFFLLVRSQDLKALVKQDKQRSPRERRRVARGLLRAILLESVVFVPASAALLLMLAPLIVPADVDAARLKATYSAIGLVSYGFPFATIRALITRVALSTLKEFASVTASPANEEEHV